MYRELQVRYLKIKGEIWKACFSAAGLVRLWFPEQFPKEKLSQAESTPETARQSQEQITLQWLQAYLGGESMGAVPVPCLDLRDGTVFQQNVWRAIRGIPLGETQSYSQIANSIENTRAVRAIGSACGANPIPVIVPCHRVLAANHKLGGFSGGISWKRRLLKLEGIAF